MPMQESLQVANVYGEIEAISIRIENHIDHERDSPPVSVSQQSKNESAHGPEGQGGGQGERHVRVAAFEFLGDVRQNHDDDKEIECVQRPAKKGSDPRSAVFSFRRELKRLIQLCQTSVYTSCRMKCAHGGDVL
jgi:hypothetical protein